MVVSTAEKAHVMRQVGAEKANVSEPLWKRRKRIDDDRNRGPVVAPGQAWRVPVFLVRRLSGAEVARARFRLRCGTWEPLAAIVPVRVLTWVGEREDLKQLICEGQSTDARQGGGPPRSSDEAPVMGAERRGRVVLILFAGQPECPGGAG
jgi:hypothetical protein